VLTGERYKLYSIMGNWGAFGYEECCLLSKQQVRAVVRLSSMEARALGWRATTEIELVGVSRSSCKCLAEIHVCCAVGGDLLLSAWHLAAALNTQPCCARAEAARYYLAQLSSGSK